MVVVTVEIWPGGDEARKRPLGKLVIVNDATGGQDKGNYDVAVSHSGRYYGKPGAWKAGKVSGYDRVRLSPYHLVARALAACGIK